MDTALAPLNRDGGENPYALQQELQEVMNSLVGIIRRESELVEALMRLEELKARVAKVSATGGRAYNPAWHLALDLRNMVLVSECTAKAALTRQESRVDTPGTTTRTWIRSGARSTWRARCLRTAPRSGWSGRCRRCRRS